MSGSFALDAEPDARFEALYTKDGALVRGDTAAAEETPDTADDTADDAAGDAAGDTTGDAAGRHRSPGRRLSVVALQRNQRCA